jgi:antitoxin component HigA of HigAB toxin-antitoxin module
MTDLQKTVYVKDPSADLDEEMRRYLESNKKGCPTLASDEDVRQCVDSLERAFEIKELNIQTIATLIPKVLEIVEDYLEEPGATKKELAIEILSRLVESKVSESGQRNELVDFIRNVGGDIIDVVVYASKGGLQLNLKKSTRRLKGCCLSLWGSTSYSACVRSSDSKV